VEVSRFVETFGDCDPYNPPRSADPPWSFGAWGTGEPAGTSRDATLRLGAGFGQFGCWQRPWRLGFLCGSGLWVARVYSRAVCQVWKRPPRLDRSRDDPAV